MPLLPISTSRTSTPLSNQRLLFQINADQLEVQRQFDKLSTGRRVLRFSDDPVASSRAFGLYSGIDRGNQLVRNATSTTSFYQAADEALSRVDTALVEARGVSVQAAQNVISDDERAALALTIQETISSVFAAGNSMFRDHQLLGGFLNSENVFEFDGAEILYNGNDAVGRAELGSGTPSQINMTGNQALGAFSVFVEGEPLNAGVDSETRLVDMRRGRGIEAGVIQFSGGGNWIELDLRSAATMGDVTNLISSTEVDGRALSATLTTDGIQVDYADGLPGTLAVVDAAGSAMASELSISNPQGLSTLPLIGDRLSPRVTPTTKIEDLDSGNGLDLSDGIQITQGDETYVIDLSDAETLGDVMIAINRSGADVRAELEQAEGRIQVRSLRSGVDYSIGENGGTAARSLGIRSATEHTRLDELGRGLGLSLNPSGPELVITRPDGVELDLELEGAETIDDLINLITDHPLNQDTLRVLADLNDFGNGIQLKSPPGVDPMRIRQVGVSDAGIQLGLIEPGSNEAVASVIGAVDTIVGRDYFPRDAGGALDTLLRLKTAVRDGDLSEIERLQAKLDVDLDRASRSRGRVGVWTRNAEQLKTVAEDNVLALRTHLSDELDADLATVISDLSQRQLALEASMRVIGQASQMTVLNFL